MLLIERSMGGVTTRQMKCQGVWSSGTTYITFEDVKVPVSHLIGKENEGFRYVMYNFNHERWSISIQASRFARVCLEEAMRYAFKRRTFGKLLIEHPVIRLKLAHMARQVEASHALMESITYQLTQMGYDEAVRVLGGPIALAKAQVTTVFEFNAREASQIFGGLSYTRGGQGEKVERLYREVRGFAIPASADTYTHSTNISRHTETLSALLSCIDRSRNHPSVHCFACCSLQWQRGDYVGFGHQAGHQGLSAAVRPTRQALSSTAPLQYHSIGRAIYQ